MEVAQAPAQSSLESQRGQRLLAGYAWLVVAWNIAVILWGAIVRATGSGAGCGNHWPLCNGEVVPHTPQIATIIEFTHRVMTGGASVAMLGLLLWTFRGTRPRHIARISAAVAALLLADEAFLGALLVKLGYVVGNQSTGRFIVLPIHLANTLLLLAALALTAHFLGREAGFMRGSVEFQYPALSLLGLAATVVVGVTGSLAALGDTLFPAASLRAAMAQDFSAASPWILRLRWVHPVSAVVAGLFIVALLWVTGMHRPGSKDRPLGLWIAGLLGFQYLLGIADVLLRAPTGMQIVHLLGADTLWVVLVVLAARFSVVPLGCAGAACPLRLKAAAARA